MRHSKDVRKSSSHNDGERGALGDSSFWSNGCRDRGQGRRSKTLSSRNVETPGTKTEKSWTNLKTDDRAPDTEGKGALDDDTTKPVDAELLDQIEYLKNVRDLEDKLQKARYKLHHAMTSSSQKQQAHQTRVITSNQDSPSLLIAPENVHQTQPVIQLRKEDFMGLVDLYYYSHRTRFLSEQPDSSPTPLQLDDYSIKVSEDFSPPTHLADETDPDSEDQARSQLYHLHAEIKSKKRSEVKALQMFVDLLIDDHSSLHDLHQAYHEMPQPGVSHLPPGVIRLLLQRMSTPWRPTKTATLRYTCLLDDMQSAGLPITSWEWSSAIYLAGRSFSSVSSDNVSAALRIWNQMEMSAKVPARAVTFNILFDLAVKAGKFVLAEGILREMHTRGFRLNRLGRVSLIYYYGKKGDGDAVRKAYRDFVNAGEIVDTLVLNCVMASLINAQEPIGAEQIYQRMKSMQERLKDGWQAEGDEPLYIRYGSQGRESVSSFASNSLGRVLLHASKLKARLPEHHAQLQNMMPLTPDAVTYRNLISYHATTSGNIDRLTVLLDDMTRVFQIPMTPLIFHLLFKGFAMHGGSMSSESDWTDQRLQLVWAACLVCIREGKAATSRSSIRPDWLNLPSVQEAEAMAWKGEGRQDAVATQKPAPRKPTSWKMFFKQLVSSGDEPEPASSNPYQQDSRDSPSEAAPGDEEAYKLPKVGLAPSHVSSESSPAPNAIQPNKLMVLWLIRAFTRCTGRRKTVEDVWFQLGKVWQPTNQADRWAAIRELRRALKYCDTHHFDKKATGS